MWCANSKCGNPTETGFWLCSKCELHRHWFQMTWVILGLGIALLTLVAIFSPNWKVNIGQTVILTGVLSAIISFAYGLFGLWEEKGVMRCMWASMTFCLIGVLIVATYTN